LRNLTLSGVKVPAKTANSQILSIFAELHVNGTELARGLNINEAQLNRMRKKKTGFYRSETLRPFTRINAVIDLAEKVFTKAGLGSGLPRLTLTSTTSPLSFA
jgi:hypothetical protein